MEVGRAQGGLARLFGLAGWGVTVRLPRAGRTRKPRAALSALELLWAGTHDLPLEAIGGRWAHRLGTWGLGEPLPMPELERVPPFGAPEQFIMGSSTGDTDEQPPQPVTIAQPFLLGATEVTFAEYDAFCDATGRQRAYDLGRPDRASRPAINVDWYDAKAYANWLGAMTQQECRLPSEAEWEYAARAGTTTEFALPAPEGSDDIAGKVLANCRGCGSEWDGQRTAPVSSFPANAWGLRDMHGNVREWVEDCWRDSYEGAPDDGSVSGEEDGGDCSVRVLRSGSWNYVQDYARSASRSGVIAGARSLDVGFRVLCSSPSSTTAP
jgi:formylglycine-generating enzyme required for sulfatase activity